MKKKEYEQYLMEFSRTDLPGLHVHPICQTAEFNTKYPFHELYKLIKGVAVFDESWEPKRLSMWSRIKNIFSK
jgi:hypothetical protein